MRKVLFCIVLLLIFTVQANAESYTDYLWIRPDGLYCDYNANSITPYVLLGWSAHTSLGRIGHAADNGGTYGAMPFEQKGFCLYTYNIFTNQSFQSSSKSTTITSIEIFSPAIKTLKGVGVGSSCGDVWAAHGKNCVIKSISYNDLGFYYQINGRYIYFCVKSTDHLDDNFQVSSIVIF